MTSTQTSTLYPPGGFGAAQIVNGNVERFLGIS